MQATPPLATPAALRIETLAWRAALAACLLLPIALLHARAVAEILIAGIDVLFLARSAMRHDFAWLHGRFARAAAIWWLWLSLCSALGTGGLLLGLLAVRLPVLALAVGEWLLPGDTSRGIARRRAMWAILAAAACWIAVQAWQQDLLGTNLFGAPRWLDGALTGPFTKPRAGPAFILLFFPALLPAVAWLAARPGLRPRLAGAALAMLAALTMVLIGQRMPTALMVLGLGISALLVPRLRIAVFCAAVAGALLAAALPWVSPLASAKLLARTSDQMAHFSHSDYGLIFTRAVALAELHPWLGLGFDGFRRGCSDVSAMHGVAWLGIPTAQHNGGLAACNIHPHNYYLEAADDAGLPGLVLFTAMVAAALARLAHGLTHGVARGLTHGVARGLTHGVARGLTHGVAHGLAHGLTPLRAGLLVGATVALWPVASTSAFTSMPNGGWVFLLLGLGFAAAPGERPVANLV